ncbi:winged helix DNA-binding domain-containing protein [Microbacterium sp. W1N]|uniref:winged helix DNA-binding domain-containing protein n=1 Tax=Microbacterium festucae TaxID=2977531 RepID=UPI0021BE96FE|nr:winged helix DNA-binding domain-containing protein [Microbacterium festucae]MCT9818845.1 winged helix DNA-binding domain-containing protein [Microbacterium festucae]
MDAAHVRHLRQGSHLLRAPAADLVRTAAHMTATQAQEFWGGRWALGVRTAGAPVLSQVDAAFDRGELVRAWTQRGTLHIVSARDLGWILQVTRDRQLRQFAGVRRAHGIPEEHVDTAARAVTAALAGGNRLTRAEFAAVLAGAGVEPTGMRANLLLSALALREDVVLGPVIPREGAPTRDQYLVAPGDWIADAATPADPVAELFVGYIRSHGPAGVADFAWWAGMPLGAARAAREAAGDRVVDTGEGMLVVPGAGSEAGVDDADEGGVVALPPFDEYYLSYADRTLACADGFTARVGPSIQGLVRPVLVARGEVAGLWSHSMAVGRHHRMPVAELFGHLDVPASEVEAALARVSRFVRG